MKFKVFLIQFIKVLSSSLWVFDFLQRAILTSSEDKELKLFVINYLTVVSPLFRISEFYTLYSEPGNSTKLNYEKFFNSESTISYKLNVNIKTLLFLISWSFSLADSFLRSLRTSFNKSFKLLCEVTALYYNPTTLELD